MARPFALDYLCPGVAFGSVSVLRSGQLPGPVTCPTAACRVLGWRSPAKAQGTPSSTARSPTTHRLLFSEFQLQLLNSSLQLGILLLLSVYLAALLFQLVNL